MMAKDAASAKRDRGGPVSDLRGPAAASGPGAAALAALERGRRRRLALILSGLAVLVAAGVAGALFLARMPPAETAKDLPARPLADRPADPLGGLGQGTRARLLADGLDRPATFKRVYGGHPRDLCAAIDRLGIPMSEWKPDPFVAGFWYCASELATIGRTAEDGRRSSLFVNLRGQGEETLNTVRIKLNGENPQSLPAARAALLRVLDAVGTRYGWPWPGDIRTAIERNRPAEVAQFGMVSRVVPEDPGLTGDADDVVRLNVIVDFPAVDLLAPAELFAPFAWEEDPSARRRNRPVGGATLRAPASGDIIFSTQDETSGETPGGIARDD